MAVRPALRIELFGGFRVVTEGHVPSRLPSTRQQQLIAFLVLHARNAAIQRQRVAGSLWPESSDTQALTNLRRELHHLKDAWPTLDAFVVAGSRTLEWSDAGAAVDVVAFEGDAERGLGGRSWRSAPGCSPVSRRHPSRLCRRVDRFRPGTSPPTRKAGAWASRQPARAGSRLRRCNRVRAAVAPPRSARRGELVRADAVSRVVVTAADRLRLADAPHCPRVVERRKRTADDHPHDDHGAPSAALRPAVRDLVQGTGAVTIATRW